MRIFVFEYITGGGCAGVPMVPSLAAEGEMMLAAAVGDLLRIEAVEVAVMRDSRLELPDLPIEVHWVERDWYASWRDCLAQADAVLPIAPESGGILEGLCREAEAAGCLLLNSSAQAVALTASKQRTLERLAQAGIPVAESFPADRLPHLPDGALVIKPDRGVGCQDIHLLLGESALTEFLEAFGDREEWVVQPYVEGTAASLSLLVGHECVCLLGANLQRVVQVDDGFLLLGCVVNGLRADREPLHRLARQICKAIPGLFGYVGVDLVMTERGPVVLEINPRLTTSYVGLSQSTGENIVEKVLQLALNPYDLPAQPVLGKCVHIDLELGRVA
jgi:tyramine---L-glutamate ligase